MLKKGKVVASWFGLVIITSLLFGSALVQAADNNANGCFSFNDRPPICPDKYCQAGSASCSKDGKRCYCRTTMLGNTSKNQSCEILFGSKFVFTINNDKPTLYLYGGIWSEVAQQVSGSPTVNGFPAIAFKQDNLGRFRSNVLYELKSAVNKVNIGGSQTSNISIVLDAQIDPDSGVGYVYNQRYEVESNGQNLSCAHLQYGDKPFFLKYSALEIDPYHQKSANPCVMPSEILKLFVFGAKRKSFFATKPKVDLTKNCSDTKDGFLSQDNIDIHLLMANLIVPQNQKRKVYMMKPANFLFGEIIDGTNTQQKIDRIKQKCKDKCQGSFPTGDCRLCDSATLDLIRANPNKSLQEIIGEALSKKDSAICNLIDTSFDGDGEVADTANSNQSTGPVNSSQTLNNSLEQLQKPGSGSTLDALKNIANNNSTTPSSPNQPVGPVDRTEELKRSLDRLKDPRNNLTDKITGKTDPDTEGAIKTDIDRQLPPRLVKICNSAKKSQQCKEFALECYTNSLTEVEPTSMCDQLTGEMTTSRWLICPLSNTLSGATDNSEAKLHKYFAFNNLSFFENSTFKQAWSTFRNISNIFLIIITLWIIIAQVTNLSLSNYSIKKMLPKLLISIILINISFVLAQLLVDLSNVTGNGLYQLFDGFAKQLRGNNIHLSMSSMAFGVISGTSLFLILGGLSVLFPAMIAMIVSFMAALLMLSLRHALLIIAVLSMPIAIVTSIIPNLESIFQKWFKNFFNILILYPTIALLYGAGRFLKYLLIGISDGSQIIQITGFVMPVMTLLATPVVLTSVTKGIAKLNKIANQYTNLSSDTAKSYANKSNFNQALRSNQKRLIDKVSSSRPLRGLYGNKAFNTLFVGSGSRLAGNVNATQGMRANNYKNIVNDDMKVLAAFHNQKGKTDNDEFRALSAAQQQSYRQLADLGAINDQAFYGVSFKIMADNGVADNPQLVITTINNATKHNVSDKELMSHLFVASKIAPKSGNPGTGGLMHYFSDQQHLHEQTIEDPKDLQQKTEAIIQKIQPADLKAADLRPTINPATGVAEESQTLRFMRQRIRQSIQTPNQPDDEHSVRKENHILSLIGSQYHKMPIEVRQQFESDIIESIRDFRVASGKPEMNFHSAEDALRSEGFMQITMQGDQP